MPDLRNSCFAHLPSINTINTALPATCACLHICYCHIAIGRCLSLQEVQDLQSQLAEAKKTKAPITTAATLLSRLASMHRDGAEMSPITRELCSSNVDPRFAAWLRDVEKVSDITCSLCQALPGTCAISAGDLKQSLQFTLKLCNMRAGLKNNGRSTAKLENNWMMLKASHVLHLYYKVCRKRKVWQLIPSEFQCVYQLGMARKLKD